MNLNEFFKGIQMVPEAVKEVEELTISESRYQEMKDLFWSDREIFYSMVLKEQNYRILFLYYYSRMACETYEQYQKRNIENRIFWDTFYDLTLWCESCFRIYGEYGIEQYGWFFRHIEGTIFRLGRLEFEKMESEWDLTDGNIEIKKGDNIINVHIPQGDRLNERQIEESYIQSYGFWGRECPYVCHSWLLNPGLSFILKEDSNILKFQKQYKVVRIDFGEREAEERIFEILRDNPEEYPEKTSLQKSAKKYLLSGKKLGNGMGILQYNM